MAAGSKELLIKNGVVITLDSQLGVIDPGAVLTRNGLVAQVGPSQQLAAAHQQAQVTDARGRIVLPGMINVHDHLYSAFARGMSLVGRPPRNFPEILKKLWWRLDKVLTLEDVYTSALVGLMECIKAGTTTIIDHHASPHAAQGSLAEVARAFRETGLRGVLCYEVSDRDGPEIAREGISENAQFLASCRGNPMLAGLFGLHASFTVSDRTLEAAREASGGAGFHIHLAEDLADIRLSVDKYRRRPVRRLLDLGILGPKTITAHGVHLSPAELDMIGESGTVITHQPQSNMNNAVGYAQVRRMLQAGVLVGMGTDGMTQSLFDEARVAPLLMRHEAKDPRVGWAEVPRLLLNNREIAGKYFPTPLGRLAPGAAGDV
ncbi:MAG: putative aminohydrolase SsnA, partial [Deinococcus sp.]|nr:putative aminohydrolase SsnA [Deinococcus sp.]